MADELAEYRIVFGAKYALDPHPVSSHIHPDGWVKVMAADTDDARFRTIEVFDRAWSNVDPVRPDDTRFFPLGELGRIDYVDNKPVLTMHAESL